MDLNSNRATGEPLTTDIEKAIEGYIGALLEELNRPYTSKEERRGIKKELLNFF